MQPAPRPQGHTPPPPTYSTPLAYQNQQPSVYQASRVARDPRYPNVYPMRPNPSLPIQPSTSTPAQVSQHQNTYEADKRERFKLGIIVGFFAVWVLISVIFVGVYLFKAV